MDIISYLQFFKEDSVDSETSQNCDINKERVQQSAEQWDIIAFSTDGYTPGLWGDQVGQGHKQPNS